MSEEAIPSEINRKCSAYTTTESAEDKNYYFSNQFFVCDPFENHWGVMFRKRTTLVNDTMLSSSRQIIQFTGLHDSTLTFPIYLLCEFL